MVKLTACSLADLSDASSTFARCPLPTATGAGNPPCMAMVVAFGGEAGNSHEHIGTFALMQAMIVAGLEAWRPDALVLDLRHLRYEWGDEMADTLCVASDWSRFPFPTTVVTSDLNRAGLASLVEQEMVADPRAWLFGNIDEALVAADRQRVQSTAEPAPAPDRTVGK